MGETTTAGSENKIITPSKMVLEATIARSLLQIISAAALSISATGSTEVTQADIVLQELGQFGQHHVCSLILEGDLNQDYFNLVLAGLAHYSQINNQTDLLPAESLKSSNCLLLISTVTSEGHIDTLEAFFSHFNVNQKRLVIITSYNDAEQATRNWTLCRNHAYEIVWYNENGVLLGSTEQFCQEERRHVDAGILGLLPYMKFSKDGVTGADIDTMDIIKSKLGLKSVAMRPSVPFDTMVTEVSEGIFDIGLSQVSLSWPRFQKVNFINSMGVYPLTWKSTLPKEIASHETLFMPFDLYIWIFLIMTCSFIAMLLWLNDALDQATLSKHPLYEALVMASQVLIAQSVPQKWFSRCLWLSKRLIFTLWLPVYCVLGMAYSCNLLSILATKRLEDTIESAEDILNRDLSLLLPKKTIVQHLLETSPVPMHKLLYKEAVLGQNGLYDYPNYVIPESVTESIESGQAVSLASTLDKELDGHKFHYAKEIVFSAHSSYVFSKDSWLEASVQKITDQLKATGIIIQLMNKHYLKEKKLMRPQPTERNQALSLYQLIPIIMALGIGVLLGNIVFIVEVLMSYFKE